MKTQTHVHPVLSHHNHVNGIAYPSNERRKKSHLTTSPASTLSDKGIGNDDFLTLVMNLLNSSEANDSTRPVYKSNIF